MKVLFTSPILEHPPAGGPQLRIENSIKALAAVSEVHVVSRAELPAERAAQTEAFLGKVARSFQYVPRLARPRPRRPGLAGKAERLLRRLATGDERDDAAFLLGEIDRLGIELLWFGYGNLSFPVIRRVRAARPRLPLVCDTDSVWSRFLLRELPYARSSRKLGIYLAGKRKEREERAWTRLAEVTAAVSEIDAEYYRGLTNQPQRVRVFPNVLDLRSYADPPAPPPGFRKPCIYLAGTFGHFHSPMDSAARWVIDEVLPRLRPRHPDLHFYIVGNNSDKGFGHLNGPAITATGRLPSVLPYLCNADVALVPLKFESGTRFKILEAGACRVPVVSTTLGAEGIPVTDGHDILLADDAEGFANAISRLLTEPALARRIAENCHALVRREFSLERLTADARDILQSLRGPAFEGGRH